MYLNLSYKVLLGDIFLENATVSEIKKKILKTNNSTKIIVLKLKPSLFAFEKEDYAHAQITCLSSLFPTGVKASLTATEARGKMFLSFVFVAGSVKPALVAFTLCATATSDREFCSCACA